MGFALAQIIAWTGGRLANAAELGNRADSITVNRPAPLTGSTASDLGFFFSRAYEGELPGAAPGVLITAEPFVQLLSVSKLPLWKSTAVVACQDPYLAMALLSEKFAAVSSSVLHGAGNTRATSIHPSAVVDPSARLGEGVQIGPNCVIERDAVIGARTVLYPSCHVGPGAKVGEDCALFSGVVLYEWTLVGNRVRIHATSVLGSDGFGYAPVRQGRDVVEHKKIYHLGRVVVGDDVEIGAGCTIDRGTFGDTVISKMAKLDNHVHVGHNASVGEGTVICGGCCLAGNAILGRFVYMGGMSGVDGHVRVGDRATVGGMSIILKDIEPGGTGVGVPQREHREHFKVHALLNKLLDERVSRRKEKGQKARGNEE